MYGEPSVYEYAKALAEADAAISDNGFSCSHNNAGWLGYYIRTPKGDKYQLVQKNDFRTSDGYCLHEYSPVSFRTGKSLGLEFATLEDCKEYLIAKEQGDNEKDIER